MTNPNKTSITVILDKSGSMDTIKTDTVGGYNSFIEDQKKLQGECYVSLVQFNHEVEFTYTSKNIQELTQGLHQDQYSPSGYTALLDAIGKSILEKGSELSNLKEEDRPGRVMFVIITDGDENSSRVFGNDKIKEMIKHQTEVYNWDFTFLGANIDTFSVANSMGISIDKSLSFSSAKMHGAKRAFASMSAYAGSTRLATSASAAATTSYSTQDRADNA